MRSAAPPLAACSLQQALPSAPKTARLGFPSGASSIRETATPADHVPRKARLCSYHAAAARKSNPATSPTTASSALSSFQTDLSEPLRQVGVYFALTK